MQLLWTVLNTLQDSIAQLSPSKSPIDHSSIQTALNGFIIQAGLLIVDFNSRRLADCSTYISISRKDAVIIDPCDSAAIRRSARYDTECTWALLFLCRRLNCNVEWHVNILVLS